MEYEPIYMIPRALEFIRAWPNVPVRPVYSLFYDAGLLYMDPNVDDPGDGNRTWPGALRWTAEGERIRDLCCSQSINFFRIVDIFKNVPVEDLEDPPKYLRCFYDLFQVAPDWPDIQKWVRARVGPPGASRAVLEAPGPALGLKVRMARLEIAVERVLAALK